MPKRPRSHEIEEFSRGRLRNLFNQMGWVVWDLHPDYGEDLLVRIFTNGAATHYSFFVQAKATDHIDRYMDKEGRYISFPIDADHLRHWEHFWEPVILTVWDAVSDVTYWEIIQDYLQSNKVSSPRKKPCVSIPTSNILDDVGLKSIFQRTRSRFQRFELTCEGVYALMNFLESRLDVEVDYEPGQEGMTIIYSEKNRSERYAFEFIPLGELAEAIVEGAENENLTPQQWFERAIQEKIERESPGFFSGHS